MQSRTPERPADTPDCTGCRATGTGRPSAGHQGTRDRRPGATELHLKIPSRWVVGLNAKHDHGTCRESLGEPSGPRAGLRVLRLDSKNHSL